MKKYEPIKKELSEKLKQGQWQNEEVIVKHESGRNKRNTQE